MTHEGHALSLGMCRWVGTALGTSITPCIHGLHSCTPLFTHKLQDWHHCLRLHPRLQDIEGAQYPLQIVDRNSLFLSNIMSHKMQEMQYLFQELGVHTSVLYEHCLCHMKLQFPFVQMEYTIEKVRQMFSTRQQSRGLQESRQQHLACCYVSICGRLRWKQSEQSQ